MRPRREGRRASPDAGAERRRPPSLEAPSETTRRARCAPERAERCATAAWVRTFSRGRRTPHVANSSLVSFRTKDTLAVPTSVWPTGCVLPLSERASRNMSFAVSRTAVAARRRPRASPRRAFRALDPRALGRVFRATHLGDRTPPRARRRTTDPRAPEELSFPELSDDEEVKGAQITAIITGASRTRTDRRDGRLGRYPSGRRGAYARTARARTQRARSSVHDDAKLTPSSSIPTGVVSVALAIGYLALVQVIDSREMLPRPPEARAGECLPGERDVDPTRRARTRLS